MKRKKRLPLSGLEVVVEAGAEETSLLVTAAGKERDRSEEAEPAEEGEQTIREEEKTSNLGDNISQDCAGDVPYLEPHSGTKCNPTRPTLSLTRAGITSTGFIEMRRLSHIPMRPAQTAREGGRGAVTGTRALLGHGVSAAKRRRRRTTSTL